MRVAKEVADWIRVAKDAGWEVETTAKNHLRFKSPAGKIVHIGSGRSTMNGRTMANAKSQLRRGGLTFPEDAERRRQLGFSGLVHPSAKVEPPAIVRSGVPRDAEWQERDDLRLHAMEHPEDILTVEDIFDGLEPSGEEVEIEVESAREKYKQEEEPVQQTKAEQPKTNGNGHPDKSMLIRFGKLSAAIDSLGDQKKMVVDLLEQAVLLELSIEDVLEALK